MTKGSDMTDQDLELAAAQAILRYNEAANALFAALKGAESIRKVLRKTVNNIDDAIHSFESDAQPDWAGLPGRTTVMEARVAADAIASARTRVKKAMSDTTESLAAVGLENLFLLPDQLEKNWRIGLAQREKAARD